MKCRAFSIDKAMTNNNPFMVGFGEEPKEMIKRNIEFNEIVENFASKTPSCKALAISGPRGSGKTVLLAQLKKYFESLDDWITVDLNPFTNMLENFASGLYDKGKLKKLFLNHDFSFSFHGLSFSISGQTPITNVNTLIEIMLKYLNEKQKKVLICIDDVDSNENLKAFIYSFQSWLREGFNVFLLMTGLYENISELENTNNLTFLLRTPKVFLNPLNIRSVTMSYENIFNLNTDDALKIAKMTNGYAYGYQLLGSLLFINGSTKLTKKIISEYDVELEDNVYAKIWQSLSSKEQNLCYGICKSKEIAQIMNFANMNNSTIQVYKKRLEKKGIIDISVRGKISFVLPRFKEFVEFQEKLLD